MNRFHRAAYAQAAYQVWGVDALTVNPYLGWDGIAPFSQYGDRGIFVLCKTSNPSSGEIQDWAQQGQPLYRHVAALAARWAGDGEIGLVVGATYPQELADLRQDAPRAWFLVPGVGAQGGDLEAVLQAGLRQDGSGVLINSSRGIMYADDPRAAAATLREQINAVRARLRRAEPEAGPSGADLRLARALFEAGCVQFGDFVLHSGAHAPIYVDLRRLVTYPRILAEVAAVYAAVLRPLEYDRIAGVPYAALPIGTAVTLQTGDPLIYPRREVKAHGTRRQIEGEFQEGERIVLLDDVISSGGSLQDALAPIEAAGLRVCDVVVLIDREQGGAANLARAGYRLHAAITLRALVDTLVWDGKVAPEDGQRVHEYLARLG
jgi:uridine monophosphate synthetase